MTPLTKLTELQMRADNEATANDISPGLVVRAQYVLEEFEGLQVRSYDYLEGKTYFLLINEKVKYFQKLCVIYVNALKETSAKKLSSIRAGNEDEAELRKIFDDIENTPFSAEKLKKWMDNIEREVSIIQACVEMMEGANVAPNDAVLAEEVLDPEVEDALCFAFTSLETVDPQLQEMSDYLESLDLKRTGDVAPSAWDPWHFSAEVIHDVREKTKEFGGLARGLKNNGRYKLIVAAVTNEKHRGANIYHYRNTVLLTDDFSKPDVTEVENITDRRDLMWYATDLTLDPETAHLKLLLSDGDKKATRGEQQSYPDLPQRFDPLIQVLSREGLTGRHYWEVEWSVTSEDGVAVGVAYKGIVRKGDGAYSKLGDGKLSWCFGNRGGPDSLQLYAKHASRQLLQERFPTEGFSRVGVYLDRPAGTLSFYKVAGDILSHFYTFRTKFSEPVFPAFLTSADKRYLFLRL